MGRLEGNSSNPELPTFYPESFFFFNEQIKFIGRFFLKESTRDDLFSDDSSALETLMFMTEEFMFCCVPSFDPAIYLAFALVEESLFFFDSSKSERSTSKF